MRRWYWSVAAVSVLGGTAAAQQVVASLPFTSSQTAGPTGTDYEPPEDDHDLWVIEDFSIAEAVQLDRFEALGTVFPSPVTVLGVTARIYDAMPPFGNLVLSSVPGTGSVVPGAATSTFRTQFQGQVLPAGSYFIVWNASTLTSLGRRAVFWAQTGPHAVGGGLPDNAWLWNPGGWWGYPNNIKKVPADLKGNGQSGVNFTLWGTPVCYANCDGSGSSPELTANDFQCFISSYVSGTAYANCDHSTGTPTLTPNDFQCFLNAFAAGCS